MRLKISVVNSSIGVVRLKTSEPQVRAVGVERFKEALYKMVDRAVEEIERSLKEGEVTYVDKTLHLGKRLLND